ncbi:type IV secretion system protein [Escherichia coli]|uniref:type IV secretion system protein n=5 Tax=Escherichia coli TaxID=562 RepID=UPI000FABFA18|nr:type IV secretion system protein [Escherichia coli]EEU9347452.1 type IV secretion system protein [Escherichia coli]EEW1450421.1 type IV secretion system protein [Escherichia coli]EEW1919026.1 type IV secretion system protein [Escherichia coli]EEW2138955.1 type IV secretion system protein [Escherichia coli]EFH4147959.1 pilus assembly protein [Escherichia coli]
MSEHGDFFLYAKEKIITVLDNSLSGQMEGFSNTAYTFGRYGVTIYALWYAYTVLAGKQKSPVQDFIWNLTRLFVILMFVKNMDGWLNYALTGIDGLKETLSGNVDVWTWLDQLWTKVQQVAAHLMAKDTSTYVKTDGAIGALFTYGGGVVALLAASIAFLMAEITLKMLAVTAPLFIFCLMFGFLRQMFNSWLQLIISSCLILLFGSLALRAGTSYLNVILSLAVDTATQRNLIQVGATALVAGIFMAFVILQAKTYASQIASVGAEGAMQGAAAMGIATAGFGAAKLGLGALKSGGRFGAGSFRGMRGKEGGFSESKGISGKTGNLVGQGAAAGYRKGKEVTKWAKQRWG